MSKKKITESKAEKLYRHYLKKVVIPITGNKSTFVGELNKAGKQLLHVKFKGVYPSDHIPRLNDLAPYCILNLDKSTEPGSHWVALAKLPDGSSLLYDSFGRHNKQIIPSLSYSGNGRIINTDKDAEQGLLESNCGARCISWLMVLDTLGPEAAMLI